MLIFLLTNAPLYRKFVCRLTNNRGKNLELKACEVLECSFGLHYKLIEYMGLSPLFRNILIGVPIGITFLDTVGYVARVEGVSMQPVLNPDIKQTDYVFLNRWAVRSYNIHHGDIVIFVSPKFPSQKLIKRVVGLSGDIVGTIGYRTPVVEVPDGHCWVEGDHTGHSMDSNSFGPVSLGLVTAKATCIVWPPSRWQYLKSAVPENRIPLRMSKPAAA